MCGRIMARAHWVAVLAAIASIANGQTLNIDLGDGPGGDGDYVGVAASGQGGTWNYINAAMDAGVPVDLVNADGSDTGVQLVASIDTQVFDADEPTDNLLDSDLMGDFHWENPGNDCTYEIRNLAPNQYNLFVYAYAGDVINDDTEIEYNGEIQTVAHIGPVDPFSHEFLDTFGLFFPVVPDENGTVAFTVRAGPGVPQILNFWQVNGLQLGVGDPSQLPPQVIFSQPTRGTNKDGCCVFNWTVRNSNPVFDVGTFHMELEAALGGRLPACTGADTITVDNPGWTANFCYPWDLGKGVSAPSSRAVITFEGPPLGPGQTIGGTIALEVNGEVSFDEPGPDPLVLPYVPPGNHIVIPAGVHVHANQGPPDAQCETGEFNSHNGLSDGWGSSINVECIPAFLPVPSMSLAAKVILAFTVLLGGLVLSVRRRTQTT